jgi:hypothetical protein
VSPFRARPDLNRLSFLKAAVTSLSATVSREYFSIGSVPIPPLEPFLSPKNGPKSAKNGDSATLMDGKKDQVTWDAKPGCELTFAASPRGGVAAALVGGRSFEKVCVSVCLCVCVCVRERERLMVETCQSNDLLV